MSAPIETTEQTAPVTEVPPVVAATATDPVVAPVEKPAAPAEPEPITPERVKHIALEGMVPVSVVKALRDRVREAEGKVKAQEAAPPVAPAPAAREESYEADDDALVSAVDRALAPHLQRIAELEGRDSARNRAALQVEYEELRTDALEGLRTRLTAARDEFMPGLKPRAAKLADRAMWGTVQEVMAERSARGEDPEEVFFEIATDVNARATVIARASQEAREALAELAGPQIEADREALKTAPLTSDGGNAAEETPDEPRSVHDPKFLALIKEQITRLMGGAQ